MKNILFIFLFTVLTFAASLQVNAQEKEENPPVVFNKNCIIKYIKSYPKDIGSYITAPGRWSKKQWLINSSVLALGGSLFLTDQWIHDQFSLNQIDNTIIQYGFKNFGNGIYTMPLMAGFFIHGLAKHNHKSLNTGLMGVKSFVLATLLTRTLKYSLNRTRPNENRGSNFWLGLSNPFGTFSENELSFPSGHTTGAFAIASVLAKNYKNKLWVPITAYTIATGVGLSRIHQGEHWGSDVFFGALIGYSVGSIVSSIACSSNTRNTNTTIKSNGTGISIFF